MEKQNTFLGRGWGFPPTFLKTKKGVEMLSDAEDVRSSLEILLSTSVGERFLRPTFGCELSKLLFEPLDTTLKTYIKDLVSDAILLHEPRVQLNEVTLATNDAAGTINISVMYTVLATNTRYNYVYPFYLTEGTAITL